MKIVADENMPLVTELFGAFGEVVTAPGRQIDRNLVADADVLLVRSVTPVDQRLLGGSRVGFVGSATIGTDHLDLACLASQNTAWANAPGCNAAAVADYVLAALCAVAPGWRERRVAIVGCGNVGSGLYRRLEALAVETRCFDPFLDQHSGLPLVPFEQVLAADIICLHTPLTRSGPHSTWHLFDAEVLAQLRPGTLVLNAGRGGVIDNRALVTELERGRLGAVLDVWEGEPDIAADLLAQVAIGTPHIAGYSLEGRIRGTLMVYNAFCRWAGVAAALSLDEALARVPGLVAGPLGLTVADAASFESLVLDAYDPRHDHRQLLAALAGTSPGGAAFDALRKNYPWRREFSHYAPQGPIPQTLASLLRGAGFALDATPC